MFPRSNSLFRLMKSDIRNFIDEHQEEVPQIFIWAQGW